MNLMSMLTDAAGGGGLDAIARRFGIETDQVMGVAASVVPALSGGLQRLMGSSEGLGQIASLLSGTDAEAAHADPEGAAETADAQGMAFLSTLFGDRADAMIDAVSEEASERAGVAADTVRGMVPAVSGMVLGGLQSRESGDASLSGMLSAFSGGGDGGSGGGGLGGMAGGLMGAVGGLLGGSGGGGAPDLSTLQGLFAASDDDDGSSAQDLLARVLDR